MAPDLGIPRLLPCPERVFGWGDAPSTRYLLKVVEQCVEPGMTVADIGAGTGILGLRAAALGARVTAYELDPRWCDLIRANAALNEVEIEVIGGTFPETWDGRQFDLALCNIGSRHTMNLSDYAKEFADGKEAAE